MNFPAGKGFDKQGKVEETLKGLSHIGVYRKQSFKVGINRKYINKTGADKLSWEGAFRPKDMSWQSLADHIGAGYPWMPAVLDPGARRWQSAANYAEVLAIDIDNGMTIEESKAHPFIASHAGLGIESASSTPEHHKFRLGFRLPSALTNWNDIRTCNKYLQTLVDVADPACKDASRFFYGAQGKKPFLLNNDARLPASFIDDAMAWKAEQDAIIEKAKQAAEYRRKLFQQLPETQDLREKVRKALTYIPQRQKGAGTYDNCFKVLCALYSEFGESEAIALAEEWSPSDGRDWDIPKKIGSLRNQSGRAITIGTLFHIAEQFGYKHPKVDRTTPEHLAKVQTPEYQAKVEAFKEEKRQEFLSGIEAKQKILSSLYLNPEQEITSRYLPPGQLPVNGGCISLIDAPMGTGKTASYLKGIVDDHRARFPKGQIINLGCRNILLYQTGRILGLKHHTSIPDVVDISKERSIQLCVDSIWKLTPEKIPFNSLLILDEIGQIFRHMLDGNTLKGNRVFVLNRFKEIVQTVIDRGGWVIGLEDGISNTEHLFLKGSLENPEEVPFHLIKSTWKPENSQRQYIVFNSASNVWSMAVQAVQDGEPILICADGADVLRDYEEKFQRLGIDPDTIWVVDSHSSKEKWAQEFANDPDPWIQTNQPRVLMYSPSIQSGGSITIPYFKKMFFHLVHLDPDTAKQLPDRYRVDCPRFGYVKEKARNDEGFTSFDPAHILKELHETVDGVGKLTEIAQYVAEQEDGGSLNQVLTRLLAKDDVEQAFWLKHWANYRAKANYGKSQLRARLLEHWRNQGHTVIESKADKIKSAFEDRQECREAIEERESILFRDRDASQMSVKEARSLLDSGVASYEDSLTARKVLLMDSLPGLEDRFNEDVEFIKKVVISDKGRYRKRAELFWAVQNVESQKLLDKWGITRLIKTAATRQELVWKPGIQTTSLKADLIGRSPLKNGLDLERYSNETEEIQEFKQWALLHRKEIKRVLGLFIKEDHTPIQCFNKFLRKLGIGTELFKVGPRGQQKAFYRFVEDPDQDAILESLTRKFEQIAAKKDEKRYQTDTVSTIPPLNTGSKIVDTRSCLNVQNDLLDKMGYQRPPVWWRDINPLPDLSALDTDSQEAILEAWDGATNEYECREVVAYAQLVLQEMAA